MISWAVVFWFFILLCLEEWQCRKMIAQPISGFASKNIFFIFQTKFSFYFKKYSRYIFQIFWQMTMQEDDSSTNIRFCIKEYFLHHPHCHLSQHQQRSWFKKKKTPNYLQIFRLLPLKKAVFVSFVEIWVLGYVLISKWDHE